MDRLLHADVKGRFVFESVICVVVLVKAPGTLCLGAFALGGKAAFSNPEMSLKVKNNSNAE